MNREELIRRLEIAIEGSRELDAVIAALGRDQATAFYVSDGDKAAETGAGEWLVLTRADQGRVTMHRPPAYTSGVDAALSLVPKGMGWEVTFTRGEHLYVAGADAHRNSETGRYDKFVGRGKTAPLAICAAALRAAESSDL